MQARTAQSNESISVSSLAPAFKHCTSNERGAMQEVAAQQRSKQERSRELHEENGFQYEQAEHTKTYFYDPQSSEHSTDSMPRFQIEEKVSNIIQQCVQDCFTPSI
jgi:hypothetical protein